MKKFKHIEINIWKACNNKCLFCMSQKPTKEMLKLVDFWVLKKKLENYSEKWYNSVWFLWWDISIHPKILDIIKLSKKLWYKKINVITNAMSFSRYDFAENLVLAWTTRVNISIHSHLHDIEDYLTQVKWWLKRKLKAIDNFNILNEKWIFKSPLSINIVVNSFNYKTIVETVLYYFKIKKINDIRINFIWLSEDVRENWDKLKLSYTEFLPYLKKLVYISIKYKIRITFDTIPACVFYKIDNINYKSLIKKFLWEDLDYITEIDHASGEDKFDWKDRKKNLLKTQFEQCKNCIYEVSCEWVRKEYGEIYGGGEFEAIKEHNKITNLNYYYEKIQKWEINDIENDILRLYKQNQNKECLNLYAVFLSKKKEYEKANNILFSLLQKYNHIDKWNVYFNIAVNYLNIWKQEEVWKYLEKAKGYIWNTDRYKVFRDNFYQNIKKYTLDDFESEVIKYYKEKDKETLDKYLYVNNLVNNIE